jgi:hypothetical protein
MAFFLILKSYNTSFEALTTARALEKALEAITDLIADSNLDFSTMGSLLVMDAIHTSYTQQTSEQR